jgi:uncharacterized iron-regulated protein
MTDRTISRAVPASILALCSVLVLALSLAAPHPGFSREARTAPQEDGKAEGTERPDLLHLPVGDPARRDRTVDLVIDGVVDTARGDVLTPARLAERLDGVRLVFFGEQHTSMNAHRAQLRLLQELERTGRPLLIGLEMFPYTAQEGLDHWTDGLLTEDGFLDLGGWYEHWGLAWGYYRDLFLFARDHGVPMVGVNTPREVVSAVRKEGLDELTEEQRDRLPPTMNLDGAGTEDHRRLFRAFFEDESGTIHSSMSDEQLESMRTAQVTWDATMAYNAVKALETAPEDAILVVLIGSGHVDYGLGAARQARQWFDGELATVVPVPAEDGDGEPVETVQASYADYVWGLPGGEQLLYPSLGASTTEAEGGGRKVIFVPEDSVAAQAGLEVGDVIVGIDGTPVPGKVAYSRVLARYRWGDAARFTVMRGEEETAVEVIFRRTADDEEDDE